jgi:hypothetical protein
MPLSPFKKARIAVIVYSTNNGSKTLIGSAYILEIFEAQDDVTTYKLVGGATLQIRGGGNLSDHLHTVKDAEHAVMSYSPVAAPAPAAVAIGHSVESMATNDPINIVFAASVESVSSNMVHQCAFCGVQCEGRKCLGCKRARYCSAYHQKLHWDDGHWQECGDDYP